MYVTLWSNPVTGVTQCRNKWWGGDTIHPVTRHRTIKLILMLTPKRWPNVVVFFFLLQNWTHLQKNNCLHWTMNNELPSKNAKMYGVCPEVSLNKISGGFTLMNVLTQSWTVVTGLAAFLDLQFRHHHPLHLTSPYGRSGHEQVRQKWRDTL